MREKNFVADDRQMRVALYSRVSSKCGRQDVQNQLLQLRDYCQHQGWTIVKEFVDHYSGKTSDREQFQAMFAAASRREFACVLFWSLDRLSREGTLETLQHLQKLTTYGVAYKSFTEPYLDSLGPFKEVVLSLLACIAKQERIRISERTLAGLARARKQGRIGGRPRLVLDRHRLLKRYREGSSFQVLADEFRISKTAAYNLVKAASA